MLHLPQIIALDREVHKIQELYKIQFLSFLSFGYFSFLFQQNVQATHPLPEGER